MENPKGRRKKPRVMLVAPFNNPHVIPFYDEVKKNEELDVTLASLHPITPQRLKLGWLEMDADSGYIQPWRSLGEKLKYFWNLLRSDVVVFPGFFHTRSLPFHHWLRRLTLKPTALWSEPFRGHPNSKGESGRKSLLRKILLWPCNSRRYSFLAMGAGAEDDYRAFGMSNWNYYQFLFSVAPHEHQQHPLQSTRKQGTKRLIYCGSLIHRKGIDVLMDAFADAAKLDEALTLTFLGDGDQRTALETQVQSLGLSERVEFLGSLPIDQCYSVFLDHDLLILPSRFDGWGAVVNEAMECSLAVIVSDHVGARRPLVQDGVNGFVFTSESTTELTEKIIAATSDPEVLVRMKEASGQMIKTFSPAALVEPFSKLCFHLTSGVPFESTSEALKALDPGSSAAGSHDANKA